VDRNEKEAATPDGEELLRIIVESSTDFAIFAMDESGTVISWNIGAERLTGHAAHEILGRSGDVIFTAEDRAARAPERERDEALAAGRAEDDRWHLRKDGSCFWGSGLLMPFRNGRSGFLKILRDRTEQHRAIEALRESEARFRLLATSIPQLVFRSRATGERTWGSPQWEIYAGLSDQESHDFGWLEALHPDDREKHVGGLADGAAVWGVQHRASHQTGFGWRVSLASDARQADW
jgi:PAS domain S-box-containing protein